MAQRRFGTRRYGSLRRRLGFNAGRATSVMLLVVACAAVALGVSHVAGKSSFVVERSAEVASDTAEALENPEVEDSSAVLEERSFIVHVDGAVAKPGVIRLEGDNLRVCDAVDAAGGLVDGADTTDVNLAEMLSDGSKIHIPFEGEEPANAGAIPPGQSMTSGATGEEAAMVLVNINTATSEELQWLPGVGEATAQAIIEDRTENGPFLSIEDLMRVSGIGEKKFSKLRASICV